MRSDVTIGLDLGDDYSYAAILDGEGMLIGEQRVAMNRGAMTRAFTRYPGSLIAMETGTQSPWVSRLLEGLGHRVLVANARNVHLISKGQRKSDRMDAEVLARLARMDPELLAPIQHRSEEAQADRAAMRARNGLVQARSSLIQQIRGMSKSMGLALPSCSTDAFPRRVRESLDGELFIGFDLMLEQIEHLSQGIQEMDRRLQERVRETYPEVALLEQVPGVGPITALWFVLTVEDPTRFAKSRHVGAYLGLCPAQHDSGSQQPQLGITKCGDPTMRRYLVQSAQHILGPFGVDSDLRRFGLALCERGGKNAKKRAVVAVARKLSVLLHRLWVTGAVYEPLYQTERRRTRQAA